MFKCKQCGREYAALPAGCVCGNADPALWEITSLPSPPPQTPPQTAPQTVRLDIPQQSVRQDAPPRQANAPRQPVPPAAPQKKKSRAPLIIGIVAGVLALVIAGIFIVKALNDNGTLSIPFFDTLFGARDAGDAEDGDDVKRAKNKKDTQKEGEETDTTDGDPETAEPGTTQAADPVETPVPGSSAVRLGFIGPLTGPAAFYGTSMRNGAKIALDEINKVAQSTGGLMLDIRLEDDAHEADRSVSAYQTLLGWGMQALIGPVTSTPAAAVAAEAEKDRVFCLTPSASATFVTEDNDVMYQLCLTDEGMGAAAAEYIAANFGGKTVGVIWQNDVLYSTELRDGFTLRLAQKGGSVVYEGAFTSDTSTDFSTQVRGAQNAGVEVLFLPVYYTEACVILKQASDIGFSPVFFGADGLDGILDVVGLDRALLEGVYVLSPFFTGNQSAQNFAAAYRSLYGEEPNQFAADGYDAVYLYYELFIKAGVTPEMTAQEACGKLSAAIAGLTFNGLTGSNMTWNSDGAVSKTVGAVVIRGGQYETP